MKGIEQLMVSNLDSDTHESLKEISCFYLLNGDITDYSNRENNAFVQNLNSNKLCVTFPNNYELAGELLLDNNEHVLFLTTDEDDHAIYLFNEDICNLTKIASGACLNFSMDHWITAKFKRTKNGRRVYFTDGVNPIRYIDIDRPYPKVKGSECKECNDTETSELDCDALRVFQKVSFPSITLSTINGSVPNGVYQVAMAYSDHDTVTSEYFVYSEVLNLHSRNGNFGIKIKFNECHKANHTHYKIALITFREDRQLSTQVIGIFETSQEEVIITQLDATSYIPISNEQLLSTNRYYQSAAFMETNSEVLVLGDTKERKEFNYQKQANLIDSQWAIIKVPAEEAHKVPSFQRDEVIPFFIQWQYDDGEYGRWTHIPNNVAPNDAFFVPVTGNNDVWEDDCNTQELKYWEVYNTATITDVYEYEDNGIVPTETLDNSFSDSCTKCVFTGNDNCPITVTYYDCNNIPQVASGLAKDIEICITNPEAIISIDYPVFNKQVDLVAISETGKCDPEQDITGSPLATCTKFKLSSIYDDIDMTITLPIGQCENIMGEGLFCSYPDIEETYTGIPNDYEFCACYDNNTSDLIEFDITVSITPVTLVPVNFCHGEQTVINATGDLCDYEIVAKGNFAWWESAIKYPNEEGFTNLRYQTNGICNTGLKFHKFPDSTLKATQGEITYPITHIHNNTGDCKSKEYVYVMTALFSNIEFPKDCFGNDIPGIIGYRIGVGDRTGNKSIIHNGLIYNMREETLENCDKSYHANYPFNDLNPDILIGTKEFLKEDEVPTRNYIGDFEPLSVISRKKFQYISPDIQYNINDNAGDELMIYAEENGYIEGRFSEEERFPPIVLLGGLPYLLIETIVLAMYALGIASIGGGGLNVPVMMETLLNLIKGNIKGKNYAYRNISKSNYTRFNLNNVVSGNRRRKINTSYYLNPVKQSVNGVNINNYQREAGLFLDLNSDVNDPDLEERSRVKIGAIEPYPSPEDSYPSPLYELSNGVCSTYYSDCYQDTYRTSSYYVGIKRRLPSQYGFLTDIIVRPITNVLKDEDTPVIIGGDVYITKHRSIRKFPLFTNLPLDGSYDQQFILSTYSNVGYPKYYIDSIERSDLLGFLINNPVLFALEGVGEIFGGNPISFNTFHLDNTGTPKKKNCDDTHNSCADGLSLFSENGVFYTHYIGVIEYFCESEFIGSYREYTDLPETQYYPIRDLDDIAKYRSILNPELFLYNPQQLWKGLPSKYPVASPYLECCDKEDPDVSYVAFSLKDDNLSNSDKWLNFRPKNFHKFVSEDGKLTGMNSLDQYNLLFRFENAAYVTQADDAIQSNGGQDLYLGIGSIFDRRLRKISSETNGLGGSIDRFSFQNTPYGAFWYDQIRRSVIYFDSKNIESALVTSQSWLNKFGTGNIRSGYDPYSKNVYFTSLNTWNLHIKPEARTKEGFSITSYHSWLPERYIQGRYNILTLSDGKIYKHNQEGKYQEFFGKHEPFDVGFLINNKFRSDLLQSLEVFCEWIEYVDWGSEIHHTNKFFDKLFIYNNFVSSGLRDVFIKDLTNPNDYLIDVKKSNLIEASYNPVNESFSLNGFYNIGKDQPLIKWEDDGVHYKPLHTLEDARDFNNGNMIGKFFKIHLVNTRHKDYKILVQLNLNTQASPEQK